MVHEAKGKFNNPNAGSASVLWRGGSSNGAATEATFFIPAQEEEEEEEEARKAPSEMFRSCKSSAATFFGAERVLKEFSRKAG